MKPAEVNKRKRALLAASVAGILALAGNQAFPGGAEAHQPGEDTVHCYGINACKGTGECGGKGHSCAGKNACQGQGWIELTEDQCLRIQGGRLTAEEEG